MVEEDDPLSILFDSISGMQYYDRSGAIMTRATWTDLFEDREKFFDYKRVAETTIGPFYVSTVWLGLDHAFGYAGKPVIFETMVFMEDTGAEDFDMERYCTEGEALAGHEEMCAKVREMLHIPDSVTEPSEFGTEVSGPEEPRNQP